MKSWLGFGVLSPGDAARFAGVWIYDEDLLQPSLERATYDSVAFRFIAGNEHPDHDTIAAFRQRDYCRSTTLVSPTGC